MFDFEPKSSRELPEPDLVPILDGLVSVIFFLLLSISFIGLTKLTLPPSANAIVPLDTGKTPVSPKMRVTQEKTNLLVELFWNTGILESSSFRVAREGGQHVHQELISKVSDIVVAFKEKFPEEKAIQLVMDPNLNYQELISVMDGIRSHVDDIVLNSYKELE